LAASEAMTADDLPGLREYLTLAQAACVAAPQRRTAALLAKLFIHYPRAEMAQGLNDERMRDWIQDLREYPADVVEAAAASWRRSKERFAPSPGQFIAKAEPIFAARRAFRDRAEKVLAAVQAKLEVAA
jgi:hypothetical protein